MAAGSGVRAAVVVGGLGEEAQLKAIRKGAQVLIATAGRLVRFSRPQAGQPERRPNTGPGRGRPDAGHGLPADHRKDHGRDARRSPDAVLFGDHRKLGQAPRREHVPNGVRIEVGSATKPAEQVRLHLYEVEQDRKLGLLKPCCGGKKARSWCSPAPNTAPSGWRRSWRQGVKTAAIHGDRSQNQRNQALRGFQEGHYRVLVATDVAARGIHVDGISHVVNYDLPQVPEDFIHRVGRTGRAGAGGTAPPSRPGPNAARSRTSNARWTSG